MESKGDVRVLVPEKAGSFENVWNGVDYHLPFQWHLVRKWIPGTYPPGRDNPQTAATEESTATVEKRKRTAADSIVEGGGSSRVVVWGHY